MTGGETWTIRKVVAWISADLSGRGIPSSRLEADLLVGHALGVERIKLYMDPDRPLSAEELGAIRALLKRRREREPLAYILGSREFYGRSFQVTRDVLIPRPDTETLLEAAVSAARTLPEGPWVELCTGSGAVAVSLALELEERSGIATDLSEAALAVARRNVEAHGVAERVTLLSGDLLAPLAGHEPAVLMVVNPPYVRAGDIEGLEPDVRDHEPRMALDGGADGLDFYRRLAASAADHLQPGGRLLMEVGYDQAGDVAALFSDGPWQGADSIDDLSGIPRVVTVECAG